VVAVVKLGIVRRVLHVSTGSLLSSVQTPLLGTLAMTVCLVGFLWLGASLQSVVRLCLAVPLGLASYLAVVGLTYKAAYATAWRALSGELGGEARLS
jgi:hypothetical protein